MHQGGEHGAYGALRDRVLASLDMLTPSERRVGSVALAAYPGSALRSASAIAADAGTSPATVLRFVGKLGFNGLPEFHAALRAEIDARLRSPFELEPPRRDTGGLLGSVLESQLRIVSETISRLPPETVSAVTRLLMEASRLWIMGGRFSQSVAHYLYAHLQLLRPDVRLLGPSPAPIADQLAYCGRRDVLVVFDFRRYQGDVAFAARFVRERRGRVVVITDPYLSPAAQAASFTLIAPVEGLAVADSYVGAIALVDALVSKILVADERRMRKRIARVEATRAALAHAAAGEYATDADGDAPAPPSGIPEQ